MHKGILVAIEGVTGTGKTYFADRLEKCLKRNHEVRVSRMGGFGPSSDRNADPPITKLLREFMASSRFIGLPWLCETTLLLSEQAYNIEQQLLPAYNSGQVILYENYNDALIAYQLVRGEVLEASEADRLEVLQTLVGFQFRPCGYPSEDVTVYLEAPLSTVVERLLARGPGNAVSEQDKEFITKVAESYNRLYSDRDVYRLCNDGETDIGGFVENIGRTVAELRG